MKTPGSPFWRDSSGSKKTTRFVTLNVLSVLVFPSSLLSWLYLYIGPISLSPVTSLLWTGVFYVLHVCATILGGSCGVEVKSEQMSLESFAEDGG